MGNKLDINSYTPSKSRHISKPQPISFYLTSLKRDISNDGIIDFAGGRSQITIIYKQQSWKSEIIQKKDIKQECRRLCKQYLVQ